MGHYAYKDILYVLPPEKVEGWNGCTDYDSELWTIAADYILELKKTIADMESANDKMSGRAQDKETK